MNSFSNTGLWRGDTLDFLLQNQLVALQQAIEDPQSSAGPRINQLAHLQLLVDEMTNLAMAQHEVLFTVAGKLLMFRRALTKQVRETADISLQPFAALGDDFLDVVEAEIPEAYRSKKRPA
mgnify:CR=1 FL=1